MTAQLIGSCRVAFGTIFVALLGFLSAHKLDWNFVQATGGICVMQPIRHGDGMDLPVKYDVSGLKEITVPPTTMNSALTIKAIRTKIKGSSIWISVVACLPEPRLSAGGIHSADISDAKPGVYDVYYGNIGDTSHKIGVVVVPK